jgi:hypothetical protein
LHHGGAVASGTSAGAEGFRNSGFNKSAVGFESPCGFVYIFSGLFINNLFFSPSFQTPTSLNSLHQVFDRTGALS